MGIMSFLDDPRAFVISLLLSLPGILLALCGHEAAHGWVAYRCGDPTAKLAGRVTLDPRRHIDPVGFLCMLFVGFGWAHPVPVNPNNFRKGRKDDLKVSLAGITANLLMCLVGFLLLTGMFFFAIKSVPVFDMASTPGADDSIFFVKFGEDAFLYSGEAQISVRLNDLFSASSGIWSFRGGDGAYHDIVDILINPALGEFWGYAYQIVMRFMMLNLTLAVFNLIPIPPLDGYHVLNDLVLKRPLFAPDRAARIGFGVMAALILIGNVNEKFDVISIVIRFVERNAFDLLTGLAYRASGLISLI